MSYYKHVYDPVSILFKQGDSFLKILSKTYRVRLEPIKRSVVKLA